MRNFALALGALSLAVPVSMTVPVSAAQARHRVYSHVYHKTCRHSPGTTGMVAGGVGGALLGHAVLGHGLLGAAAGGVGGVFAGRAIDRSITAKRRCHYS
jgi:uncharacterized protein YcfJ